jgi:hypothetical protein
MSLNMKKEIRREIRELNAAKKQIWRERDAACRPLTKQMGEVKRKLAEQTRESHRIHRALWLQSKRLHDRASRCQGKIEKRILVLEGRLS